MPYSIEKLPDEPIVMYVHHPGGNPMLDMMDALIDIGKALDAQPEPVFMVYDITVITVALEDLMHAASKAARGNNAVLHHPNVRENVYITADSLIRMAIKGLSSATFGLVKASQFATRADALAYCRERIQESDSQY